MATYQSNIPVAVARMRARAARAVRRAAASVEADVKERMAEPKHGRQYSRSEGVTHTASAPGESPAVDSGLYSQTVFATAVDETTSAVGTTDERGPVLELGGGRVAARPHFGPAFERAREGFEEDLAKVFEE